MKRTATYIVGLLALIAGCATNSVPIGVVAATNCPGGMAEIAVAGVGRAGACWCTAQGESICTAIPMPQEPCPERYTLKFICEPQKESAP